MAFDVTLRDEHEMLITELLQNRQIQLQAFATTPVWVGVFFGLLASGGPWPEEQAALVLMPVPLVFINMLLILDRGVVSAYIAICITSSDKEPERITYWKPGRGLYAETWGSRCVRIVSLDPVATRG